MSGCPCGHDRCARQQYLTRVNRLIRAVRVLAVLAVLAVTGWAAAGWLPHP